MSNSATPLNEELPAEFSGRVLIVEDEPYTRLLLVDALSSRGISVEGAATAGEALELVASHDPHIVVSDLDLGPGPNGADLLNRLREDRPWLGLIALTGHANPELALPPGLSLPEGTQFLVKTHLAEVGILVDALKASLSGGDRNPSLKTELNPLDKESRVLTRTQGEVLRLIALGLSNDAIAQERGTTLRATEVQVQRVFAELGLSATGGVNSRVLAATMWREGKVSIG
jgi:DNA-binding NarL/FixJ family response regulator